jgi:toxin-antitoxin system PIN domain toxin
MFVVDTNVLIYAANHSCPEHRRCLDLLQKWRRQPSAWFVTWGILYGFIRIVTHPRVLPNPWRIADAWRFVEALLASPGLDILTETSLHDDVCAELITEVPQLAGNLVTDLHIAVLMREHGVKVVYTRDADFYRFPFLEVRDPLQTEA